MKKYGFFFLLAFFCFTSSIFAANPKLYLFHSNTCPHCQEEREYLKELQKTNPNLEIIEYEVTENTENSELLKNVKKTLKDYNNYVPYTVIGENTLVGFNDNTKNRIAYYLEKCTKEECPDIVKRVKQEGKAVDLKEQVEQEEPTDFDVPMLGNIDAKNVSLPLLAIVIGFVDGFNPCAMWVLLFLISMLLGMKDKKRMWILGLTFLITSALIYLLFMLAWLKITLQMNQIVWIRTLIGIVALGFGSYQLYRFYKERKEAVGCTVTDQKSRQKMMQRIQKFTHEKSFLLSLFGVIVLAISVNFVELSCSAGLPLLFTQVLSINQLTTMEYAIYMGLYILFYLLDDIFVFVISMVSLKITGITNKYNRYSHLIGGIIMVLIGVLMLVKPEILMFQW